MTQETWLEGSIKNNIISDEIDDFLKILIEEQKVENSMHHHTFPSIDDAFSMDGSNSSPSTSSPCSPMQLPPVMNLYPPQQHDGTFAMCVPEPEANDGTYKYDPRPLGRKKRRNLVPEEKKTTDYWERRKRNNQAARRSREERRIKELETFNSMKVLQNENVSLKQTVQMYMRNQQEMENEILLLKQMLNQQQNFKKYPMAP